MLLLGTCWRIIYKEYYTARQIRVEFSLENKIECKFFATVWSVVCSLVFDLTLIVYLGFITYD